MVAQIVPRDAATVILIRDGRERPGLEVFLVRRTAKASFMGGAHVFPGGKLDDGDRDPRVLARAALDADQARARLGEPIEPALALGLFVAAIRETLEEAGVLFGSLGGACDAQRIEDLRRSLEGGRPLAELIEPLDIQLEPSALVPFARWITPAIEPKRFDARFFLAIAPESSEARHDDREVVAGVWMRPAEAIQAHTRAEIHLPPPTLRTLEELATYGSPEAAIAAARARVPRPVEPLLRDVGGAPVLVLPGDPLHPEPEPAVFGVPRLRLAGDRFVTG